MCCAPTKQARRGFDAGQIETVPPSIDARFVRFNLARAISTASGIVGFFAMRRSRGNATTYYKSTPVVS